MLRHAIRIVVLMLALASAVPATATPSEVDRLAALLAGDYSNAAQARADTDYYFAFLHAVPIWTGRADGRWLYVEQVLEMSPRSPYRQNVLRLVARADGKVEAWLFALPDPPAFAGAWQDSGAAFAKLDPKALVAREGCAIVFAPSADGGFAGVTEGTACPIDARGARYVKTEMTVTAADVRVWERVYGVRDEQVAGPKSGPYVFARAKAGG